MSEPVAVEVAVVTDPAGRPAVLLQFSEGWLVLSPAGAQILARTLRDVAEEARRVQSSGPPDPF